MHAALATDGKYRHNVRVVQLRRRVGLVLEALQLSWVHRRREGQYLQRHAPAEGKLLRFVDHSHPAPANFADDPEVTQGTVDAIVPTRRGWIVRLQRGAGDFQEIKRVQTFHKARTKLGVLGAKSRAIKGTA